MRIDREEKAARAEALFREGYNCAQSVVLAYAEEMGLEMKTAARLSSGFGGGVGGLRGVCGAVSGMAMVYGMLCGYDRPEEKRARRPSMPPFSAWPTASAKRRRRSTAVRCWSARALIPRICPASGTPNIMRSGPARAWCGKPLRFWLTSSTRKALARRPKPRQGPEAPVPRLDRHAKRPGPHLRGSGRLSARRLTAAPRLFG